MRGNLHIRFLFAWLIIGCWTEASALYLQQQDTVKADTIGPYEPNIRPTFQPAYRFGDPFANRISRSPLFLRDPSQLDMQVRFNPDTTAEDAGVTYSVYENIGDLNFRPATFMSFNEFNQYNNSQLNRQYFKDKSAGLDGESAVSGRSLIPRLYMSPVFDRIFGGSYVDIQPNGFVNLDFGGRFQRVDNPSLTRRQQRNGSFNFDQQISMNVVGKVGEKLAITANFDNNNSFDFQNNMRVEYTGYEEDIIKKIEIGNVSMPVSNSLISGANSLFGVKTDLQFGKLFVSTILSQQRSSFVEYGIEGGNLVASGGNRTSDRYPNEITGSQYQANQHFFLGHFFRDNYEKWLEGVSGLSGVNSGVRIVQVEVYVINPNETENVRGIVGLMDLGEGTRIYSPGDVTGTPGPARNGANNLNALIGASPVSIGEAKTYLEGQFPSFEEGIDYEREQFAVKMDESRYILNEQLGYISLKAPLRTNELLAVSYTYTYNGRSYQVGELTQDYLGRSADQAIFLKLLKPIQPIQTPQLPTWDLMMKNAYNLRVGNLGDDGAGFSLEIIYKDDSGQDNPSLNEGSFKGENLLRVFELDNLQATGDFGFDGNFDFLPGVTVLPREGIIFFPVLEPFGETLRKKFNPDEVDLIEKYVFDELYELPQSEVVNYTSKDKFFLRPSGGSGGGAGGNNCSFPAPIIGTGEEEIVVRWNNTILNEGTDYFFSGGQITLNDEWCKLQDQISIGLERPDLFSFQTKTFVGTRLDYRFSDNFNIGGTLLHYNERTGGISRFAVGDEPVSNTKYGFDLNYQNESRFLTKMVDALPLVSTKEPSSVTLNLEFAQLLPGTSNKVNGEGISYLDDFESSIIPINIGGWQAWKLASTPRGDYPTAWDSETLENRFNAAKIAWYTVDNSIFYNNSRNLNPIDGEITNHYERSVLPQEIFRQRDPNLVNFNEPLFDIAYFPEERGQYNYNPATQADNTLNNDPRSNYGGIMRTISGETNLSENNIEYIEFWLMDPFIQDGQDGVIRDGRLNRANTTGGELVFNLGDISQDIARDGFTAHEQGLPLNSTEPVLTDLNSEWGRVEEDIPLIDFFDNSPGARENQDIGLDGLKDENEDLILQQRGLSLNVSEDISNDNFKYILDPEYEGINSIVQRYKSWNGMENNSALGTSGNQNFIPSSTNQPDKEYQIELPSKTAKGNENYYEYRFPLNFDASPQNGYMELNDYITDQILAQDGVTTWYQVRIPINRNYRRVGNPPPLQGGSINFIRMYLTGWQEPVVLRMAQFRMVGSQWQKYEQSLREPGLNELPEQRTSDFDLSVVSIEENSTDDANGIRYVLPPGFNRDIDNTTTQNRRFNEQSIQICVEDLADKDARAIVKNDLGFDLINYGRLSMFLHAEAVGNDVLLDDEVSVFLRLGTDQNVGYYEIEVPMKVTPTNLVGTDEDIRRQVWPLENEIDVSIAELIGTKSQRTFQNLPEDIPFSIPSNDGRYTFTVLGRPDLSDVRVLMIGVRNPGDPGGAPKSVCIWANELRVSDFDRNAGWAANARLNTKLADLATVNANTSYTSIGFGGIQQKIAQRSRAETKSYDVSVNMNLEKFMRPDKTGLVVPMFVSYSNQTSTPQFDPLNRDVPLEATLESFDTEEERERYKRIVEDRTTSRSLSFLNVRKEKVNPDAKRRVYDIENFSLSYSYRDRVRSNENLESEIDKTVSGGIDYNYSPAAPSIEPFKNTERLKSPYLALIQDFNFSPLPSSFSMSANLNRNFVQTRYYNEQLEPDDDALYRRQFTFIRNYNMRWDLTKGLGITYSARAYALIDEPDGDGSPIEGDIDTREEKEFIWDQILGLGRMKSFDQDVAVNYSLPLDKLPFTDWVSADARYATGYSWIAGAIDQGVNTPDSLLFGNSISNQRTMGLTSRIDMNRLYDKVTFLKNANTPPAKNEKVSPGNQMLRTLMMLQSINASYSINESTTLPGFAPQAYLFGLDDAFDAPGVEFILGSQDPEIRSRAAANGWLVENPNLNSPFEQTYGTDLDVKADIKPFNEVSVQLSWNRGFSNRYQEIFRYNDDPNVNAFETLTPTRSGSYSTSFLSLKTAFEPRDDNNASASFDQLENNLSIIQARLNALNEAGEYDPISQDVLVPAFIAAYSGKDANTIALSPFPKTPLPNWRLDYTGLSKIPALQELFSSFTISHGYNSAYSVSNFTSALNYDENDLGLQNSLLDYPLADTSSTGRLVPIYIINQVMVSEQFVPLVGINFRTQNNISTRLEYKKSRNLSLNMSNAQVTETLNDEVTLDFGYSKTGFKLPWRWQGRTITLKNDITFRIAGSIRNSRTIQRRLFDESTLTNGNVQFRISPNISYKINNQLDFAFYFERNVNTPLVGRSFKTARTNFGFQLRFNLAQ